MIIVCSANILILVVVEMKIFKLGFFVRKLHTNQMPIDRERMRDRMILIFMIMRIDILLALL